MVDLTGFEPVTSGSANQRSNPTELQVLLVCPAGFEPATFGLGNQHSIQLNYGHIKWTRVVEDRRVELLTHPCHGCVIPLHQSPILTNHMRDH